jgi:tetratricopeptide (TPR) repeat protein
VAHRATAARNVAHEELARLNVSPGAEWLRMVQASGMSVEDGGLITDALEWERAESAEVFKQLHRREIDAESDEPLNARAGRCLEAGKPVVLPWGAWAEFSQRHLAMLVGRLDSYYRRSLGSTETADQQLLALELELRDLSMFPLATIFRTQGPRGSDADLRYINEAISVAVQAPERVTTAVWSFLESGANYEAVRYGMPPKGDWFSRPTVRMPYAAGTRVQDLGLPAADTVNGLLREAPYDYLLGSEILRRTHGDKPPYSDVVRVFAPRLEYDIRALRAARDRASDPEDRLRLSRTSCSVAAAECMALGAELASQKQPDAAASEYERAFTDPSVDVVVMANNAGWLVDYYFEKGRTAPALALAERAGNTGAYQGLIIQSYLYERLGRFDDAERTYREAATGYNRPEALIGFYYRAVNVRKQNAYEAVFKQHLAEVFPDGLVAVASAETQPATGVIVMKDSELSRAAGLQAGDIIVGLEGWRVDNLRQYRAINAFFTGDDMKIAAWRGRVLQVSVTAPNRLMGIEFRSHPIKGWGED